MVKVCEAQFPYTPGVEGDLRKSAGFYMDDTHKDNLDVYVRAISKDNFFTFIVTGHGMVRVGKSVFVQQNATYLTNKVNEVYGLNNTFTVDNMIFKADQLIDKAFSAPKYSVLVLDEGDDLTENFWSHLAKSLRRFFRKCGQLNLFLILVLPDFFELPKAYAVTRSIALMDVRFEGEFDRGYFRFYNYKLKRLLYTLGKKEGDYDKVKCNYEGRFAHFYTIDEAAYREKKKRDLSDDKDEVTKRVSRVFTDEKVFMAIDWLLEHNRTLQEIAFKLDFKYETLRKEYSKWKKREDILK